MARRSTLLAIPLALLLGLLPGVAQAHNGLTVPDCPVLILKRASAKPQVDLSLDASGSMSGQRIADAKDVIKIIVQDPVVGGNAIDYGYYEWSSNRTGSCVGRRFVNIPLPSANTSAAVVTQMNSGFSAWGGTPQNTALQAELAYYVNSIIPNDTITCRKRFILMITDGGWNCGGNPCPTATLCGAQNIKIIAVAAFGVGVGAVQCMATNSGGVAVAAQNRAQLLQVLRDQLGQTLGGHVNVGPSVVATIKDRSDPRTYMVTDNVNVVAALEMPAFQAHIDAFELYELDPTDPAGVKVRPTDYANAGDYRLLFDAGDVTSASYTSANRNTIFTSDRWATCFRDSALADYPAGCASTATPPPINPVTFATGMTDPQGVPMKDLFTLSTAAQADALIQFIRGRSVNTTPNPWTLGNDKAFKVYASLAEGMSVMQPPEYELGSGDIDWAAFRQAWASRSTMRETVLMAQTDSGGVHGFSTESWNANTPGKEKWMFIPRENLSRLKNLLINGGQTIDSYTYFAQGRTVVSEIKVNNGSTEDYITLLTFGLGNGGRSYYGLDVTDPSVRPEILWAFTGDNNVGSGDLGKAVLSDTRGGGQNDFGTVGLALAVPVSSDPAKTDQGLVFGSGPANSHLSQPVAAPDCVGTPLDTETQTGHVAYRVDAYSGMLRGSADITTLNEHDILRGQFNSLYRSAINGVQKERGGLASDDLAAIHGNYVFGGSQGNLYQWDGNVSTGLTLLTQARTGAEPASVLETRPITRGPLLAKPFKEDPVTGQSSTCSVNGTAVELAAFFGTGDDGTASGPPGTTGPPQYLFAVDLTAGPYPSYNQLPGSPVLLADREIMVGDARIVDITPPGSPLPKSRAVVFLTFRNASSPCGSGVSTLWTLNTCDLGNGGWDVNGDGTVSTSDRKIDLSTATAGGEGAGRVTSVAFSQGQVVVTGANGMLSFRRPATGPNGEGVLPDLDPNVPPITQTFGWRIKD